MISSFKEIHTKKGDRMLFLGISDYTSTIEAVVFPKTLEEYQEVLQPEACVLVKGKLSDRNGEKSIIIDSAHVSP